MAEVKPRKPGIAGEAVFWYNEAILSMNGTEQERKQNNEAEPENGQVEGQPAREPPAAPVEAPAPSCAEASEGQGTGPAEPEQTKPVEPAAAPPENLPADGPAEETVKETGESGQAANQAVEGQAGAAGNAAGGSGNGAEAGEKPNALPETVDRSVAAPESGSAAREAAGTAPVQTIQTAPTQTTIIVPSNTGTREWMRQLYEKSRMWVDFRKKARKEKIMALAGKKGRVTHQEVRNLLSISDAGATNYLNALVKEGKLMRAGAGTHTFYKPIN